MGLFNEITRQKDLKDILYKNYKLVQNIRINFYALKANLEKVMVLSDRWLRLLERWWRWTLKFINALAIANIQKNARRT